MLTADQIIHRLHWGEHWSLRKIARHLHIGRPTVTKYLHTPAPTPARRQRASKLDPYKPVIAELLQQDPTVTNSMIGRHLRTMGYAGGHSILRDYVRHIRTIPSQPLLRRSRQEVFDWMRAVLQAALSRDNLAKELDQVAELDKLLAAVWNGRLPDRNRAMAILARARGIRQAYTCSFLHISKGAATRYWNQYQRGGSKVLFARKEKSGTKFKDDAIKQAVFGLLHTPPSVHGINRSTWRLTDLQNVLHGQGQPVCRDVIRVIIKQAGYKWRKARLVLTSQDPEYRVKIAALKKILSELRKDEAFFSIAHSR